MTHLPIGIFSKEEKIILQSFKTNYPYKIRAINKGLKIYEECIIAISGHIKDSDRPNYSVLLLLSQPLLLINNSLQLLSRGYPRSAEALLRVNREAVITAAYFKVFPGVEEEFFTLEGKEFALRHPLKNMLKRIERVNGLFFKSEEKVAKLLFRIVCGESNKFVHINFSVIYEFLKRNDIGLENNTDLIQGPNKISDEISKIIINRILFCLVFSIDVIKAVFNINLNSSEMKNYIFCRKNLDGFEKITT